MTETPRKKRRWRRRLAATLLVAPIVLVAVVIAVLVFLPSIVTEERVRHELVSALTESLGVEVKIGRVRYATFSGIELFDVSIGAPPGFSREVLRAKRIAVRYRLAPFERKVELNEVAVDEPRAIIERVGRETSLDAIRRHLSKGRPPAEKKREREEPPHPLRGRLSPVTLALDVLAIRELSVAIVGDGPNLSAEGVGLEASAKLDPAAASATLVLSVKRDRASPEKPNIVVDLPEEMAHGAPLHAEIGATFTTTIAASADTHDGVAVEAAKIAVALRTAIDARYGDRKPPHTSLDVGMGLEARPSEDSAALERLSIRLNGTTLVAAGARLDGLFALISGFLGDAATEALGSQFGLANKAKEGVVKVSLDRIAVPLTELSPYLEMVRPDVRVKGAVALAPVEIEGTARELIAGAPRKLSAALSFDGVRAEVASMPLSVAAIDGRIEASKRAEDAPESPAFTVGGALRFDRIVQRRNSVGSAEVKIGFDFDRIAYSTPGAVDGHIELAVRAVAVPSLKVDRARVLAEIAGRDLFSPLRPETDPIDVHAVVEGNRIGVGTGTTGIAIEKLALDAKAALDRLLEPARRPIAAKIGLGVGALRIDGRGIAVERARVGVDARSTDPRGPGAIDAKATVSLEAKRLSTPQASLEDPRISLIADAASITERRIAPLGSKAMMLPGSVDTDLEIDLPKVSISHPRLGAFDTKLRLKSSAGANLVNGTANLGALEVKAADAVTIKASGRAKDVFRKRPWFDAKVEIPPIDLGRLVQALPPGLKRSVPNLRASGTLAMNAKAVGSAPDESIDLDLEDPPISADLAFELKDVGAELPSQKVSLAGLSGRLEAAVAKARSEIAVNLSLKQVARGEESARAEGKQVSVKLRAGVLDEVWQAAADITAEKLASGLDRGAVQGASISLDAIYPKRGALELRRLDVKVPGSGVDVAMKGRLERKRFGVLRPDLSIDARLDFDRLRKLVPEVGDAHGKLAAFLGVKTEMETMVDATGRVELEDFGYVVPNVLRVKKATGRIPIDQRLALPAAQLREDIASFIGVTGDDLEARLYELSWDLQALKIVLSSEDILVAPPRTADFESLRPYYAATGPELKIEEVLYGAQLLRNITFVGDWKSGVFRVERLSAAVWEGDVLGDLAIQLTADRNMRMRARLTLTDLNLDIPYALAKKIEPVKGSDREDYKISGTADLQFALRQRVVDGRIDLAKLRKPSVDRIFGLLLDPNSPAQNAMSQSEVAGVVPVALHVWITRNLLSLNLDWKPVYVRFNFDSIPTFFLSLPPVRIFLTPTLGAFVMDTVNNSVRGVSIGNILEANLDDAMIERMLGFMNGKVTAEEARDNAPAPSAASKVSER
jgi:hypothetical protein